SSLASSLRAPRPLSSLNSFIRSTIDSRQFKSSCCADAVFLISSSSSGRDIGLPVAAGAPALAGELVGAAGEAGEAGAAGDAGLGADGLQDVGAGVGAGSAACEEPKIAETSLPKMLMLSSSSGGPCAVAPHADDGMGARQRP